ncbi:MAG: rhomboid family intramembrane serine protease [Nannocystaceae bacterium]|nr:rhomboid family intramembrane serine protease [Nannocystaceae bacterium]
MPSARFCDVVQTLIDEPTGARLMALRDGAATLAMRDGTFAAVVDATVVVEPQLGERLRLFVDRNPHADVKIVLVDATPAQRDVLTRLQPAVMMRRVVQVFTLAAQGTAWAGPRSRLDSPTGLALTAVGQRETPRAITMESLASQLEAIDPEAQARAREAIDFVSRTRQGWPPATVSLLAVCAVVFGLEALWGGTELLPLHARMGANVPSLRDEPWRLLSATWLHAGPLHLLVNGYVLFGLGGFLERLLGWRRFLLLYAISALGGGIASAAFSDAALSVGASGAIWGVLGATVALAWRPAGLIPDSIVPQLRRNAIVNTVLNVAISFMPQIDMFAHLGGGLAGATLIATGLLTRGVDGDAEVVRRAERRLMIPAVISTALLLASLVVAWVIGRPWQLTQLDRTESIALPGVDASITVPRGLQAPVLHTEDGQSAVVIGDLLHDPLTVMLASSSHAPLPPDELDDAFESFAESPLPSLDGATAQGEPELLTAADAGGWPAVQQRFEYPNGIEVIVRYQLRLDATWRMDGAYWPAVPGAAAAVRDAMASVHTPATP